MNVPGLEFGCHCIRERVRGGAFAICHMGYRDLLVGFFFCLWFWFWFGLLACLLVCLTVGGVLGRIRCVLKVELLCVIWGIVHKSLRVEGKGHIRNIPFE